MRVQVRVTLDIDPNKWAEYYGLNDISELESDVQDWADAVLHDDALESGVLA